MDLSHINLDKQPNKLLVQTKLAFLAGVFEGEGSFGIWSCGKGRRYFRIQLEMTDEDIVVQFKKFFNIGTITVRKSRGDNYKRQYHWRANGLPAINCLYTMFPFFGKRRQDKFIKAIKELKEKHSTTPIVT